MRAIVALGLALALGGCQLAVEFDRSRLGAESSDAAATPDAGVDADVDARATDGAEGDADAEARDAG